MIIIIIAVFTLTSFFSFMFIKKRTVRWTLGILSFLLLAASVFTLMCHITGNWGMKEVTKTTTVPIYTAGDSSAAYGMMIKSEIGKNTGNYVLIYRTSKDEKKPSTNFLPNQKHISDAIKKTASYKFVDSTKATLTTTSSHRVFSSGLMKTLFSFGGEQNELVKQKSVVSVPKTTWLVLTQAQVEKLSKEAASMQAETEAELKANPQLALQMAKLQKENPADYAAQQVSQIKALLGIKD